MEKTKEHSVLSTTRIEHQFEQALSIAAERWEQAWQVRMEHHDPTIHFDRPLNVLPVSVTGDACALNCAHCGGYYLRHMHPIWDVEPKGATTCLISGGCDKEGRVPVMPHLDRIAALSKEHRLVWHVGFIDEEEMQAIAPYVDVISFDMVGDAETVREVYGLDATLDDYVRTFDMVQQYAPVVPHIIIGLRCGKLSGERAVLEALQDRALEKLIFIILIPTEGTAYAHCSPPPLQQVAELFLDARMLLPDTDIYLGCMRPHGDYRQRVDELAIRAGLNCIVNPTQAAEDMAAKRGLQIVWGDECCALD
ncbi:MAG: radical SAM protein [Chloroflexota bacterium]|nr:radical SAM protein [Chloroflexota bacterium]